MEQKRLGRIGYLGFSFHASEQTLIRLVDLRGWDFAQIQMNYFDWMYGSAKREYEILTEKNIPVMVMEPVRGGRLATLSPEAERILKSEHPDWTLASWALRWVKRLPGVQVVLSGMSTLEQIKENIRLFEDDNALTDDDEATLFRACEAFRKEVRVPCTACRYCCDDCPAQINIPAVLEVYNRYKTDGPWALNALKGIDSQGMPKDCIACGACMEHCPQNIDIKGIMQELAEIQ
jgi:predicted aldo/keto reductase-like oxidoreductase